MNISIRKATKEDYEGLCTVIEALDMLHAENLPSIFQQPQKPARPESFIENVLEDEKHAMFVAVYNTTIIGFIHVCVLRAPFAPVFVQREYGEIQGLYVGKKFRHFGIGQKLMEVAHKWVRLQGITEVELNVYEFNKYAAAFYEKLGYSTTSKRMRKVLT